MRRPALLYGTALSTLVAAFLLTPREAPPAPTPEPKAPQAPIDKHPVTHLSYANGTLQVDARIERGLLLASHGQLAGEPVHLDIGLHAREAAARARLAAVLVIDRSGSMAGEKIDSARMSAERFVHRLEDGDQLAIVSYGSDVSVDMALTEVSPTSRTAARRALARLEEGGGTHIDGGLKAAERLLASADLRGFVGRVMLISDGRATEGERRTERLSRHGDALRQMGVTVSTLGVGLDYHEDLMEQLAVSGGGRYHYLRKAHELGPILDDELKHAAAVVARGVELHVPKDLGGLAVVEAPGYALRELGGRVVIRVGDLAAGETRRLLLRLEPVPGTALESTGLRFSPPEVLYTPVGGGVQELLAHRADRFCLFTSGDAAAVQESTREDVRVRVLQVTTSLELTRSMAEYSRGDVEQAARRLTVKKQALERAAATTGNRELAFEAQNLDHVLRQVQRQAPSSADAQDLVKYEKARAYQLRR